MDGEKACLLGKEKALFRSLSGGDTKEDAKLKYRSVFSSNFGLSNSDILEEDLPNNCSEDGSSENGHSLGPDSECFEEADKNYEQKGLGTFSGVFAPVTLSMCSTMLFLRMGYVVGNAGVSGSVLMILISCIILVSTMLSLSAIATNGAVEGGGVYFMLTRTLGKQYEVSTWERGSS